MALRTLTDHPKFLRIKRLLGLSRFEALGLLEGLWHFTGLYAPRGDVGKYSDEDLAAWLECRIEASELVSALVKSGWLDEHPEHRLIIHDWSDHADSYTHARLAKSCELFADGRMPRIPHDAFNAPTRARIMAEYRKRHPELVDDEVENDQGGTGQSYRAAKRKDESVGSCPGLVRAPSKDSPGPVRDLSGNVPGKVPPIPVSGAGSGSVSGEEATRGVTPTVGAGSDADAPESARVERDPLEHHPILNGFWEELLRLMHQAHPNAKTIPPPGTQRWMEWRGELAALARLDGYGEQDIEECLRWLFLDEKPAADGFSWRAQVQSVPALRKRRSADQPSKFARIFEKWQTQGFDSSRVHHVYQGENKIVFSGSKVPID